MGHAIKNKRGSLVTNVIVGWQAEQKWNPGKELISLKLAYRELGIEEGGCGVLG